MAKSTALWSSALHDLEYQYSQPGGNNSKHKVAACAAVSKLATKCRGLPATSWLKLLTDLEVVHCIATACKHAVQWGSDAASLQAVLTSLGHVNQVIIQVIGRADSKHSNASLLMQPGGRASEQLRASVQQQVERSGLLAEFAGLARSTADRLSMATSSSLLPSADNSSSSRSTSDQLEQLRSTLVRPVCLVCLGLLDIWPRGIACLSAAGQTAASTVAGTTAGVLQLACAVLQGSHLEQSDVSHKEEGVFTDASYTDEAFYAAHKALSHLYAPHTTGAGSTAGPASSSSLLSSTAHVEQLLGSAHYAPSLCLITSTTSVAVLYQEQQHLDTGARTPAGAKGGSFGFRFEPAVQDSIASVFQHVGMPLQTVRKVAERAAEDPAEQHVVGFAVMRWALYALKDLLQLWSGDGGGQQLLPSGVAQLQVAVETLLLPSVLAHWAPGSGFNLAVQAELLTLLAEHVPANAAGSSAAHTAAPSSDATDPGLSSASGSSVTAHDSTAGSTHDSAAAAAAVSQPSVTGLLSAQAFLVPVLQEFEGTVRTVARSAPLAANAFVLQNAVRGMALLCHCLIDKDAFLDRGGLLVRWACSAGCAKQQRLCSLLVSMLRFSSQHMAWNRPPLGVVANELRLGAAVAACHMLAFGPSCEACDDARNSSSSSSKLPASVPGDAFDGALNIFGRCCLQWAQQLQAEIPLVLRERVGMLQGRPAGRGGSISPFKDTDLDAAQICLEFRFTDESCLLETLIGFVRQGLTAAEVDPSGVSKQQLLSELDQLQGGAFPAAKNPSTANPVPLVALAKQLHSTGLAFSAIAVPHMCNNPACSTVRGNTELDLEAGKSCACGGCRTARYCCADCQRQHWPQHRPVCKALGAVAPADAGQGDSTGACSSTSAPQPERTE